MSDQEFSPYEMAEMYLDEAQLYLDYIREDLTAGRNKGSRYRLETALIHLGVTKHNVEMLGFTIDKIQGEAAANA